MESRSSLSWLRRPGSSWKKTTLALVCVCVCALLGALALRGRGKYFRRGAGALVVTPTTPAPPGSALHIIQNSRKFCLSLEREPQRWVNFYDSAQFVFPDVSRLEAVDARAIDVRADPRISVENKWRLLVSRTRNTHQEMTVVGAVGCTLSHVRAWEEFMKSSATHLLVFEDDADVHNGTLAQFADVHHFPASGWHVWLLGGDVRRASPIDDVWNEVHEFHHTHALLLTREAVALLQQYVMPIEVQIDGFMGYLADLGLLKIIHTPRVDISYRPEGSGIKNAWILSELLKDLFGIISIVLAVLIAIGVVLYRNRQVVLPYLRRWTSDAAVAPRHDQ